MKLIHFFGLLTLFVNNLLGQENEYSINIPGLPKKVEVIKIGSMTYLPTFYCKVDTMFYLGHSSVVDGKLDISWLIGYVDQRDSLRLLDYFDNYHFDHPELFGEQGIRTDPPVATYYKLKWKKRKHIYKVLIQNQIMYNWWGSDFQKYNGVIIPVDK